MAGGGSSGPFVRRSPNELANLVRKAEDSTSVAEFESQLSTLLAGYLGSFNDRDVALVRDRLEEVKKALEDQVEGTFDQIFGGSVAKHTYVDGLSDIDSIVVINGTDLEGKRPNEVLDDMEKVISENISDNIDVKHGDMAVTLEYDDGMKLQLLPAIKSENGNLRIPSSRRNDWSQIEPDGFRRALAECNHDCGEKLVPTIKLAKAVNGALPEAQRLSGYHMESMGIAIFRNYGGPKTTAAMLPVFFERAKELVLAPMQDSTGQSLYVDDYLGPTGSDARRAASHLLARIAKRMRNATAAGSPAQWNAIFGVDEE